MRWFLKKKYLEKLILPNTGKVKFFNIERKSNTKIQTTITSVVTYHSLLKSLSGIVNSNIYLLNMDQEVKKVFILQSLVSYRRAHKLSR